MILRVFLFTIVAWSVNTMAFFPKSQLGIGMTDHLVIDLPSISVKYHLSDKSAISGHLGANSDSETNQYALGAKYFRSIYKEQSLDFYSSLGLTLFTYNLNNDDEFGHQFDWTFGTEFGFKNIESLAFSLEFGLSAVKYLERSSIRTTGNNILKAAVHFYL